ncbi:hypothetical protein LCGC14_2036900 [marine sediment metagenome]|uniref:Uncharacterized protein n=1 Tax=marine sediment metagenome TaxID=412755 RepID=A0A0F9ESW9_9ZZZZ
MQNVAERLNPNGHDDPEEETQEQLDTTFKKLSNLTRADGSVVSMTKQELGLLQRILRAADEEYKEQAMWRMCDFVDENEALDHVAAFYEAKELGMDTTFNVAFMFALCSANRKIGKTNLMAQLLDTMQHGKWAQGNVKGKGNDNRNPRSPLA